MPPQDDRPPAIVPREALDYFDRKELKPAFSYRDVWREEHTVAFTVAKVLETDILADVQGSLSRALEEGETFRQWSKSIRDTLDGSGWSDYAAKTDAQRASRLYTIYSTNMKVARAVGQWNRIQRTTKTHPFLQYALGPSERHRPEHLALDGKILPANDPFWDEWMPPNGWGCKCHVMQISRTTVDRHGGVSDRPAIPRYEAKNPKTGQKEQIPKGIDPGWNYNPGKSSTTQRKSTIEG